MKEVCSEVDVVGIKGNLDQVEKTCLGKAHAMTNSIYYGNGDSPFRAMD